MLPRFGFALVCGLMLLCGHSRGAEESSFDSKGVKIHYLVEGEGEPVVLIHGFVVNKEIQWGLPGIIKALAKDYRVIALDNRGHGKSDKPTDPKQYGMEMVEDVVRLMDHLHIKKAHVVGYSMGAIITSKLMVAHPERLLSATLGGAGPFREGTPPPKFIPELIDSLEQGKGMGPLIVALTPPGKPKPTEEQIDQINQLMVGKRGKVLAAVVRGWKDLTVTDEQLKANKVPALALIGEVDPLKKSVDAIKDRMTHLQIVVIDKGDHVSAFADKQFIRGLRKFLEKHRQKVKEKVPARVGR
jgi:pimeloyl-ACP methyl ester carboxylesterase